MKRYMKSLLFGFVVPFFAILSLFGVGYSTWYFVNDAIKRDGITISTNITGVADFGRIVINYDKDSVEDISSPSLNSKIIVESDRIHLNSPFYVHYLLPKGALISSAGKLKFNLKLTVDSGYVAGKTVADIMKVSYLPYSHGNSSDGKLINVDEKKVVVTTPADNTERRIVTYNGIQWRQDIELVSSKDATTLDPYNKFTVSDEGKVEEDGQYKVVSSSDSTLREDDKEAAKDTFVFCSGNLSSDNLSSDNLSFKFPEGFRITDNSDEVDVKKNVYLYKDIVQIFSNAKISFTFSVSL